MAEILERVRASLSDKYEVERELGRGGMSLVFLARDERHDRKVALKVLRPELAASVGSDRFLREVQIEASLQHPHILPLYDSGETDGLLYYTMPYVEGETLRERIRREEQLSVDDVVSISSDVAEALTYAHEHGVVHRDIKPENILLSGDHAMVTDFGVARAVSQAGGEQLTASGVAIGTPMYMSPEQATGTTTIDARSDVYSLGLVVYEMLAGEPPFKGPTPAAVLARQATEQAPSVEVARPNVPPEVAYVVQKALAKTPSDRYQTAVAFSCALSSGASGELTVPRIGPRKTNLGLDPNSIVLYPLEWGGGNGDGGEARDDHALVGENAAYLIVAWLDGRGSFTWVNGWHLLEDRYRENVRLLRHEQKSALAVAEEAAYYVDGRAIPTGSDSVRIILALHRARRERPFARADTIGPLSSATQLGVMAAGKLLLSLLPSGQTVDVSDVGGIDPQAIQIMVQAEREFHSGRFRRALELYREAVERDSAFALAGARGAQAASWNHEAGEARELIAVAVANEEQLAPRWAHFARAFEAYLGNRGDSAAYHFQRAIELDDDWPEGWMGLGEVYQHLLPSNPPQDSIAKSAFEQVYQRTEGYVPALYHLTEFAMREGDFDRASGFLAEYRAADPDPDVLANLELALSCAQGTPSAINWRNHVLEDVDRVYQAGKSLGVGGAYPECAVAAWQAVLDHDTTTNEAWLFSSLVGLQSMLVAMGRSEELRALLDSAGASGTRSGETGLLQYIVDEHAGADVAPQAREIADSLRRELDDLSSTRRWFLAFWDVYHGELDEARLLRDYLTARGNDGDRDDALMAVGLSGHIALAEGDTASAVRAFAQLVPAGTRGQLTRPWESLGAEHLALARIHMARGEYDDAYRVARCFDSPGAASVVYPVFLRASIELRLEAARALGWEENIAVLEQRLAVLGAGL
jgi:tetratricopeptide (TPR) repeat protein/predicted Ser/Thr protein kinase